MTLFTTKYAPKNEAQVFGQQKAVGILKNYILNYKSQKKRAILLHGPIGNGKTSSVYALAQEFGYDVLEINSSDLRNKDNMSSFLSSVLGQQSLFFRPKIVLIDEIDNISGVKDRGAVPALVKAIQKSTFPVVLTANEIEDSKLKPLKKACLLNEYRPLEYRTIAHTLQWVCEQEGIEFEEQAIISLARQADGDLRGALIDLQGCVGDKMFVADDIATLSDRKRTETIMNALTLIFKSSNVENALPALSDVDLDLTQVMLWIDENLPKEYLDAKSLHRAYEHLALADVFNGRIRKRQHWRFLAYVNNLLTAGISSAKTQKNTNYVAYQRTMRLLRIWQSNIKNAKKKEIAKKLALATHTSIKVALGQIGYLQQLFKSGGGKDVAKELELSFDEVTWLKR